jgi:hypothetical protein
MGIFDCFSKVEKVAFTTAGLFFVSLLVYSARQRVLKSPESSPSLVVQTNEQIVEIPSSKSTGDELKLSKLELNPVAVIVPAEFSQGRTMTSRKLASEVEEVLASPDPNTLLVGEPKNSSEDKAPKVEEPLPVTPKVNAGLVNDFWIWAGAGVNFTNYSQTVPGFSTVNFGRIKAPTQIFRAGFFFDDHLGLDLSYKNTPGEVTGGSSISVSNGRYDWKTLSAEILYRPANFEDDKRNEWLWRLGAQQHQMPFIVPLTANSISIEKNNMTALSAGVEYRKFTRKKVRVEAMLRYQQPIGSSAGVGSSFDIKPKMTFDGSLGAAYELKPNMFLGAYWYGQYSSFNFDYKSNNGTSYSGSQNLFMTSFDIRLGVEF